MFKYCTLLCVLSSFAVILMGKRAQAGCFILYESSWCLVTVIVLLLFFTVPLVGLQCAIVVFPDHTHVFSIGDTRERGRSVQSMSRLTSWQHPLSWHVLLHVHSKTHQLDSMGFPVADKTKRKVQHN